MLRMVDDAEIAKDEDMPQNTSGFFRDITSLAKGRLIGLSGIFIVYRSLVGIGTESAESTGMA